MRKSVAVDERGTSYCVDWENHTIQGGVFVEPTNFIGNITVFQGEPIVVELANGQFYQTEDIRKVYVANTPEVPRKLEVQKEPTKFKITTNGGTVYTIDEKEKTIQGGQLAQAVKYEEINTIRVGEQLKGFWPNGNPFRTRTVLNITPIREMQNEHQH